MENVESNVTYSDFPIICRVCLSKTDLRTFEDGLLDLFKNITDIKFEPEDKLPKNVCTMCINQIKSISSFIQLSKANNAKLKEILERRAKEPTSDSDVGDEFLGTLDDDNTNVKDESYDSTGIIKEISTQSNKGIRSNTKFERHSTKKQASKCEICGESFTTKSKLNEHQKKNSGCRTRKYKCFICEKAFYAKFRLKLHIRSHTKETPFECKICFKKFRHSPNLKRHDDIVHKGLKPYKCEVCGKVFTRLYTKNEHMHIHNGKQPYICNYCGKSFRNQSTYFAHTQFHKINNGEISETEGTKIKADLKCKVCSKICSSKVAVHNHIQIHLDEKKFLCMFCGKKFLRKVQLESHSRIHTGEKPHKCKFCKKQFSHIAGYRKHILVHTGEKPYQCTYCGKTFTQHSHLSSHTKTHTGEKPYKCNFCAKAFAVRGNLKVHMRIHTGETPYQCSICSMGFYESSSMKKHKKVHEIVNLSRT